VAALSLPKLEVDHIPRRQHLDLSFVSNPLTVIPDWSAISTLPTQTTAYRFGKRFFDLILGFLILPVAVPLTLVIAGVIAVTSGGPVFFRQARIGQYGRKFRILKFRTMHVRAEKALQEFLESNPEAHQEWAQTHKLRRDPRVGALGRFLRKMSLDELPQILNVLKGEMSFVGPRPIVHAERQKYGDRFVFYTAVVPGITGLWQVSGRCDVGYNERVVFDEDYASNWTPLLDLKILFRTPRAVIRCGGAY